MTATPSPFTIAERQRRSAARLTRLARISAPAVFAVLALTGCGGSPPAAAPPPPAVQVVSVQEATINTAYRMVGRTLAVESVDLVARVPGFLERRAFQEGSDIERGQLLFEIERAPYAAEVSSAEAGVANAEATLANARQYRERLESVQKGAVAAAELDAAQAAEREAAAGVQAARARLQRARIDLGYTRITAPISGQINRAAVTEGNLVGPDSGVLATIVRLNPMYVTFTASERDVLNVRQEALDEGAALPTFVPTLELANGRKYGPPGQVDFVDNRVDPTTGTLTIRASFPNPDHLLLPGQFVTVTAERQQPRQALLVPQKAVQQDQAGPSVLVVGSGDRVEERRVVLGERRDTEWIVEEGLQAGERVIVEGLQKVRPGAAVTPVPADTEAPAETSAEAGS